MIFEGTKNQFFFGLELTRAGKKMPNIENLFALAEILHTTVDDLCVREIVEV